MTRYLALVLTAVFWASAFPGIRAGLAGYAPGHLVLLRFLVAAAALAVVWLVRGCTLPRREDLPRIVVAGVLAFTVYPFALSVGEKTVDAGTASVLVNLSPIFTALFAASLLKERLNAVGWAGIGVAFLGATMVAGGSATLRAGPGLVAVVLAAIVQAAQFVATKPLLRRYDAVAVTIYSVFAGTLADLVFARGFVEAVRTAPLSATLAIIFLGIVPTAIATVLWSYGLARVSAPVAASFLYLVPPVSILVSWLWLGERPGAAMIAGAAVAMLGVAIVKTSTMPATAPPSPVPVRDE